MKQLLFSALLMITMGIIIQTKASGGIDPKVMGPGIWNIIYLVGDLLLVFSCVGLYYKNNK